MRCLKYSFLSCLIFTAYTIAAPVIADSTLNSSNSWYQQGETWLQKKLINQQASNLDSKSPTAKNVILFVGDGMSITTLTASRIWQGQQQGLLGEEHFLHFEYFPHTALIKTYNTNQQTPDSAGTMSAIMTGVKTRAGLISMGPEQELSDCKGSEQHQQQTLLEWGHKQGFDTGIITTARLTHATPAASYAHSPDRGWEGDYDRHPNAYWYGCDSIAKQLINTAFPAGLDLALGGGGSKLESYYSDFNQQFPQGQLLTEAKHLQQLEFTSTVNSELGPILGVFSQEHLAFEQDKASSSKAANSHGQPSLQQMTKKAIQYFQLSLIHI